MKGRKRTRWDEPPRSLGTQRPLLSLLPQQGNFPVSQWPDPMQSSPPNNHDPFDELKRRTPPPPANEADCPPFNPVDEPINPGVQHHLKQRRNYGCSQSEYFGRTYQNPYQDPYHVYQGPYREQYQGQFRYPRGRGGAYHGNFDSHQQNREDGWFYEDSFVVLSKENDWVDPSTVQEEVEQNKTASKEKSDEEKRPLLGSAEEMERIVKEKSEWLKNIMKNKNLKDTESRLEEIKRQKAAQSEQPQAMEAKNRKLYIVAESSVLESDSLETVRKNLGDGLPDESNLLTSLLQEGAPSASTRSARSVTQHHEAIDLEELPSRSLRKQFPGLSRMLIRGSQKTKNLRGTANKKRAEIITGLKPSVGRAEDHKRNIESLLQKLEENSRVFVPTPAFKPNLNTTRMKTIEYTPSHVGDPVRAKRQSLLECVSKLAGVPKFKDLRQLKSLIENPRPGKFEHYLNEQIKKYRLSSCRTVDISGEAFKQDEKFFGDVQQQQVIKKEDPLKQGSFEGEDLMSYLGKWSECDVRMEDLPQEFIQELGELLELDVTTPLSFDQQVDPDSEVELLVDMEVTTCSTKPGIRVRDFASLCEPTPISPTVNTVATSMASPMASPVVSSGAAVPVARQMVSPGVAVPVARMVSPAATHVVRPVVSPAAATVARPVVSSAVATVDRPVVSPAAATVARLVVSPAAATVACPVVSSAVATVARPVVSPAAVTVARPVVSPVAATVARPVVSPAAATVARPVVSPAAATVARPVVSPAAVPVSCLVVSPPDASVNRPVIPPMVPPATHHPLDGPNLLASCAVNITRAQPSVGNFKSKNKNIVQGEAFYFGDTSRKKTKSLGQKPRKKSAEVSGPLPDSTVVLSGCVDVLSDDSKSVIKGKAREKKKANSSLSGAVCSSECSDDEEGRLSSDSKDEPSILARLQEIIKEMNDLKGKLKKLEDEKEILYSLLPKIRKESKRKKISSDSEEEEVRRRIFSDVCADLENSSKSFDYKTRNKKAKKKKTPTVSVAQVLPVSPVTKPKEAVLPISPGSKVRAASTKSLLVDPQLAKGTIAYFMQDFAVTCEKEAFPKDLGIVTQIMVIKKSILASTGNGQIHMLNSSTGQIKRTYRCGFHPIKSFCLGQNKSKVTVLVAGTGDGFLHCFKFLSGDKLLEPISLTNDINCIDSKWGLVYIGSKSGSIIKYDLTKMKTHVLTAENGTIYGIKCASEGPRKVLVCASSKWGIELRNAKDALLLRRLTNWDSGPNLWGVPEYKFAVDLNADRVAYSRSGEVHILEFSNPQGTVCHKTVSHVSCMQLRKNILYVGCRDGCIRRFDVKTNEVLPQLPGKCNVVCMDVIDGKVIMARKRGMFDIIPIPGIEGNDPPTVQLD